MISSARLLIGSSGGYSIRKGQGLEGRIATLKTYCERGPTRRSEFLKQRELYFMEPVSGITAAKNERFSREQAPLAKFQPMISPEPTKQDKALKRVLTISRLNGWSVVVFAAIGTLITLVIGDFSGMAIGVLIGVAGWMEIRGHKKLTRRDPEGMKLLVRSQLFLLAVILVYCAGRLGSFDDGTVMASLTPDMEALLKEAGINKTDILPLVRTAFFAGYGGFALATLLYQGGMALYYRGKTLAVTEALTAAPKRVSHFPPSV